MKEICIIVPHKALISSVEDARYMFSMVNEYLKKSGKSPVFSIKLVGLTNEVVLEKGMYTIKTDAVIHNVPRPDLVIIPSMSGDMITPLALNLNFNPWLISIYQQGTEIASLCVGSFLLAATGLLKENYCSTHWLYANEFRVFFPGIKLVDDKIVTEHNGIYTSGGSTSYWNLLLHLVEKYTDKSTAIWASKYFALDIARNSQSPFAIFNGQKEHSHKDVLEVQEFIEQNYRSKLTVDELAGKFNIGRRSLERRFRKATGNAVVEYVQRVKVEAAKKLLESGRTTVNEVMYDVGYTHISAFRKLFRKVTGMSPVEYRNKHNR
jgi:transcriptional regulator GlxA family with amidase domain